MTQVMASVLHQQTQMACDRARFTALTVLLGMTCSTLGMAVAALFPSGEVALAVGPALMIVYVITGAVGPTGAGMSPPPALVIIGDDWVPVE